MLGRVVVESLAVLLSEHPAVRATKAIRAEVNLSAGWVSYLRLSLQYLLWSQLRWQVHRTRT